MPNPALLIADRPGAVLRRLAEARPPSLLVTVVAIALVDGAFCLWTGVRMADDSHTYAFWSGRLIDSGFDYASLHAEADPRFPAVLYTLFVTLVALLRLGFGEAWPAALVALNLAAHVGLGAMIVRLAQRATGSGAAGWVALLLFLGCFDLLNWVSFAMSDATFVLLAFIVFTLAARRILGDAKGWLPVVVPATAGIFYRPTGIVLVPDLILAFHLSRRPHAPVRRGAILAALVASLVAGLVLFAWLMQDPGRWPFRILAGAFDFVAQRYAAGEVVSARLETYHSPPGALIDFVLISVDRFVHFFALGAGTHSLGHLLVSAAFLLPCYLLGGWLLAALWRGDTDYAAPVRKLFVTAAGAVLAYGFFHALVQVDFDWRYRTPILPHLILLAAGGTADIVRRIAAR